MDKVEMNLERDLPEWRKVRIHRVTVAKIHGTALMTTRMTLMKTGKVHLNPQKRPRIRLCLRLQIIVAFLDDPELDPKTNDP